MFDSIQSGNMREFQQDARPLKPEKPLIVISIVERLQKAVEENAQLTGRMNDRLSVVRIEEPGTVGEDKAPAPMLPSLPAALLDVLTRLEKSNDCLRYNLRTLQI